jgi:hypothetical protein
MKIYRKLLQGILTCFKQFSHIETLYNDMAATAEVPLGLTSLGLRQYITK